MRFELCKHNAYTLGDFAGFGHRAQRDVEHRRCWAPSPSHQATEQFPALIHPSEAPKRASVLDCEWETRDTPILSDYQIFHNYIRPHEALNGKTPAEACGIKVEGEN